ncbi:hypothetical protein [Methylococcus sp. EFPC2]|uniref:hypothetical protein n=1 Tax=Methylococcus sp. EFPC2 TaxID=2812648 RepID=UPI0019684B72|nr:hypothetical protein [Methylococcus sp. EFPC2]QSA98278.1 hypothetical protein JWZ97_05535 [Methylococcus sp. EFPC2]
MGAAIIILSLVGAVACHEIARSRGARDVVFWTSMGLFFGPFAIPFAWFSTRKS